MLSGKEELSANGLEGLKQVFAGLNPQSECFIHFKFDQSGANQRSAILKVDMPNLLVGFYELHAYNILPLEQEVIAEFLSQNGLSKEIALQRIYDNFQEIRGRKLQAFNSGEPFHFNNDPVFAKRELTRILTTALEKNPVPAALAHQSAASNTQKPGTGWRPSFFATPSSPPQDENPAQNKSNSTGLGKK